MSTSQGIDLVGGFATDGEFPVGHQLVAVQLDPGLHQTQLLAGQFAGQNFALTDSDRRFELGVLGMEYSRMMMP
jgi:hypothetical protein